ncbi:hypothetical protein FRC10_010884 [Ceratobasidium sp. 414]|nr:hypothetical protein FRC10_010884 [Ceratobasidium sp. 414]
MSSTQSPTSAAPETTSTKPIWATGPEQITVELLLGKTYDIDVDIAKRMNIIHGRSPKLEFGASRTSKELVTVTACSTRDFENALTFCANDRTQSQPPTPELARIMSEMDPTSATPALSASNTQTTTGQRLTDLGPNNEEEDEEADESYHPSSESSASDSGEDYSDTDMADLGVAELRAERKAHGSPSPTPEPPTGSLSQEPATRSVTQRLAGLQLADEGNHEEEDEDESYAPSSDSSASDSGDEYSNTDAADVGVAEIKAEREEFQAKQGA